jgi:Zn-dependent alcohol dehydrogenase
LRNLSDQPATVTILLNGNTTSDTWKNVTFKYDDKVRSIKFGMFKDFRKEIKVRQIDIATVEFTIPPKSTVFIGSGLNTGFWGGFEQAKVKVGDTEQSFTTSDKQKMNLKMKGLTRYTGHYDIVI